MPLTLNPSTQPAVSGVSFSKIKLLKIDVKKNEAITFNLNPFIPSSAPCLEDTSYGGTVL